MAPPRMSSAMLDVLALMLAAWESDQELHGWQIMRSVRRSGPTVYGVLDRLEDAGWVSASWEPRTAEQPTRPRRRFYRLTPTGAEAARDQAILPVRAPRLRPKPAPGFGRIVSPRPAC